MNKSQTSVMEYTEQEQVWIRALASDEWKQGHLIESRTADEVKDIIAQIEDIDRKVPGGLLSYLKRARTLLEASAKGENPYEGYTVQVPSGESPIVGSPEFARFEQIGNQNLHKCAFVLVAGGLGERLGYNGIKVELPVDLVSDYTHLELYIKTILAYQEEYNMSKPGLQNPKLLRLCIMTSDDTHDLTVDLLEKNHFYGAHPKQVILFKQEKVPALIDSEARMSTIRQDGRICIETKPHGHGDVHYLLHHTNLAKALAADGVEHIVFFQDTNSLVFHAVPVTLGVSIDRQFVMNTVTVPRKPGEAVGGIARLISNAGDKNLTINVEYNQLAPLLQAAGQEDAADPETGYSAFPGNTNVFIVNAARYLEVLDENKGVLGEFVNPKYADVERTTFRSSARLEMMMQDLPKAFNSEDKVGFTQLERWLCFSAVKNNVNDAAVKAQQGLAPESALSAEADRYACHTRLLELAVKAVEGKFKGNEAVKHEYLGVEYMVGPKVVLLPTFAQSFEHLKSRMHKDVEIDLSGGCDVTLLLGGRTVEVSKILISKCGALIVDVNGEPPSLSTDINLSVDNKGWTLEKLPGDEIEGAYGPRLLVRGYRMRKSECISIHKNSNIMTKSRLAPMAGQTMVVKSVDEDDTQEEELRLTTYDEIYSNNIDRAQEE